MSLVFAIAFGVLLALGVLRLLAAVVDWLDARTSRISETEARHRAQLALRGKWPRTVERVTLAPRAWIITAGLLLLLWELSRLLTPPQQARLLTAPERRQPHSTLAHTALAQSAISLWDSDPSAPSETSSGD